MAPTPSPSTAATHARVGHVLQGRYEGILVDKRGYPLELCRYVVLNPLRAGLVRKPDATR